MNDMDAEFILEKPIVPAEFYDANLGRVLGKLHEKEHMDEQGFKTMASIYTADLAVVTAENLEKAVEGNIHFLGRLQANFIECKKAISNAVSADDLQDIGTMIENDSEKIPSVFYRHYDTTITIDGEPYADLAIVIHSSAHDKRWHKRIDRILKNNRDNLNIKIKETIFQHFKCHLELEAVVKALIRSTEKSLHQMAEIILRYPKMTEDVPKMEKTNSRRTWNMI
jgi:hypothetical protein